MIRPATRADLAAVQRITDAAFAPYIPRIGGRPVPMDEDYAALIADGVVWVAEEDGVVAGHCVVIEHPDHVLLDVVAVDPAQHGRGIGGRLVAHAEALAAAGPGRVRLYTHRLMTENIAIYEHLGYRRIPPPPVDALPRVHFEKVC